MRQLLDSTKCSFYNPTFDFDNKECESYTFAQDDMMNIVHGECGFCKRPDMYRCLADITRSIPLSKSSVETSLTCYHLYWLQAIRGIRVRNNMMNNAVKAGQLWDTVKRKKLGGEADIQKVIKDYEIDEHTVAKVRALAKAYTELEISCDPDPQIQAKINLQYEIKLNKNSFIPKVYVGSEPLSLWEDRTDAALSQILCITGYYDVKYPNYFCEDKLTSRPGFYLDPFFLQLQNGTYFLADPSLEYCIEMPVLFPQQKSIKTHKDESPDVLFARCYQDILSRPSEYFIGWDREKRRYGKKFYRGEFDLVQINAVYMQAVLNIMSARWNDGFYRNYRVCNNVLPGISCDYKEICMFGNMSENKYYIRDKNQGRG